MLDADVYGFSVPRMLGVTTRPTRVADMILPPVAHGVKVISVGMFVEGNAAVVWRGPMLHRALQQFLGDVFWGDLDVLLLDLPPGTGDIAISTAQLIPTAELLVVTTPQLAAAEVAERAGSIAIQTRQRIAGVVENMSGLVLPDGSVLDVFGSGGGRQVASSLSRLTGVDVPVLGNVPLDPRVREAGDGGTPIVSSAPQSVPAQVLGRHRPDTGRSFEAAGRGSTGAVGRRSLRPPVAVAVAPRRRRPRSHEIASIPRCFIGFRPFRGTERQRGQPAARCWTSSASATAWSWTTDTGSAGTEASDSDSTQYFRPAAEHDHRAGR